MSGTHLDEEENAPRALKNFLGMTSDEMIELGVEGADSPELAIRAQFEQKVKDCLSQHEEAWRKLSPTALIEQAGTIASFQLMAQRAVQFADEEQMEYLLRFVDPLQVLTDYWNDQTGMNPEEDDAIRHILWEITDKQAAEVDYEMEPEFYRSTTQETQSPELTM